MAAGRNDETNGSDSVGGKLIGCGMAVRHGRSESKPQSSQKQQEKIRQEALKQAEALFAGKQQRPEYKKALAKLEDQRATAQFLATAEKFLKEYGLPEDWRGLMLFLDYSDPAVMAEAMTRLQQLAHSQSMTELQGLERQIANLVPDLPFSGN